MIWLGRYEGSLGRKFAGRWGEMLYVRIVRVRAACCFGGDMSGVLAACRRRNCVETRNNPG